MDAAKRDLKASYAMVLFSILGAAFMGYLTSVHFDSGDSSLCDLGGAFNCHIVNQSIFSELLGVPVSILGMGFFLAVAVIALKKNIENRYRLIALITIFCLVFSLYLTVIEVMYLGTVCLFCEGSKALMLAILGIALWRVRERKDQLSPAAIVAAVAAGLIFTGTARWLQNI